jgi:hypothetical protein
MNLDAATVSDAIVVWTGWGQEPWPSRDEKRLIDRFGIELAGSLMPAIRQLEEDFYTSEARDVATDLREMGEIAASEFREKHPEVSEEATAALAWCYTYDYK